MRVKKEYTSTLGLLLITVWSAIQYIFLQIVPDSVSTFSFLLITSLVGLLILAAVQPKKLKLLSKKKLLKGMLLAGELIGFNFFLLLGSKGMDSVIVSSMVSMYFVFVTPILLILKKKVSFRSAIASAVAIAALLLMFNADLEQFFGSSKVLFLVIADLFFALYVITVSILGENEDSAALTISQMIFCVLFSSAGWCVEVAVGVSSFSFPTDTMFWVSVLFIGVFIRGLYTLIQVSCQKHVKPVNASLIFSSEIIITLITTPLLSGIMHTEYTPATVYQIIGCVLFVIAVLVVDDTVMKRIGYTDMETITYVDENGVTRTQSTLSRKLTNMTLVISVTALVISAVVCIASIMSIKTTSVGMSTELGKSAAERSEGALKAELEKELTNTVRDKAMLAEQKLRFYVSSAQYASDYAAELFGNPSDYAEKEVMYPMSKNTGIWAMQRYLEDENVTYSQVESENKLLGNMEEIFDSIVRNNENVSTIYIGTESGLLISYDPNSEYANPDEENYYEYRETDWYQAGAETDEPFFTNSYQDSYGRGLTITCVSPIHDSDGTFRGCIGIDVLMNDINSSMVNDNIVDPNYATLIDNEGYIIASKDVDSLSSGTATIYDEDVDTPIKQVVGTVLGNSEGITCVGTGVDAIYISYAHIPLTDWTLCIVSPVSNIIGPAISIRHDISVNTRTVADTVNASIREIINSCLLLFAIILLVITFAAGGLAKKIVYPLQRLERDVMEISCGNFDQRTLVSTDDEIGSLARAFNHMTESLQQYIANLKDMAVKEERIASELSVATKIQSDMLPDNFDDLKRREFDIFASMTPAKEVGGDFYDLFFVDDNHLAMVIADVSGKGVPAALFMMTSKTMIKSAAQAGLPPRDVLEKVNNQLCENNEAGMFVTVWLGILEISTGKMVCANAGHEYPAIKRRDGAFELFKDKHGFVLAGMECSRYREYELKFNVGDMIFVYTDGVCEATNGNDELYGTDNMILALNKEPGISCRELLNTVHEDVNEFVGDAIQFDDITMLCMQYKGPEE